MKSYCAILKLETPLGTPLKGDTLFGHICWQIAYDKDLFNATLDELLKDYSNAPFCVVSSGFPIVQNNNQYTFLFRAPSLPPELLFSEHITDVGLFVKERKKLKKKKWMVLSGSNGYLKKASYYTDKEVLNLLMNIPDDELLREVPYIHNSIQRTSFTTSREGFAPYSVYNLYFHPSLFIGVVICTYEEYVEPVKKALKRIGRMGFGRDASSGLGKFRVYDFIDFDASGFCKHSPDSLYTLSPSVVDPEDFKDCFYMPFHRYGRHGDIMAKSSNPFKNPVVMLDEGAVLLPKNKDLLNKPYIGKALDGLSIVFEKTVQQGYAPCISVILEVHNV